MGKGTFEANRILTEDNGSEFETAAIGPAGENLVNYSTINTSFGNSGGGGIGAVMGSKNLKGFAIRGTGSVKVADSKKLLELNKYMLTELIGGNNNHNVPAVPQSWAEYSAVNGKNRWSGAPGRRWEKADGGAIDTGEQPFDDNNKIAYRCLKGVFDHGEVASNYIIKQGDVPLVQFVVILSMIWIHLQILIFQRWYPIPVYQFYMDLCGIQMVLRILSTEGDARLVLSGAASHAQDDLGLWCNYANLERDFNWLCTSGKIKEVLPKAEYDSLPWEWEKSGDPRWAVEIMRRIAYKEGELATIGEGTMAMVEKWNLGKEFYDRIDSNNTNITYNGYPKHHANEDSGQIGLLFNLMYNRDCMIHHLTNVENSGAPYEVTKATMEGFLEKDAMIEQRLIIQ